MIENKRSMSDKILKYAKYKGYINGSKKISNTNAAKLALYYADQFPKDLEKVKKEIEKLSV